MAAARYGRPRYQEVEDKEAQHQILQLSSQKLNNKDLVRVIQELENTTFAHSHCRALRGRARGSHASPPPPPPPLFAMHAANNSLDTLPLPLFLLHIQELHLSSNRFVSLEVFAPFAQLRVLDASFNRLTTTWGLSALTLLRGLNLKGNSIRTVAGLETLAALELLDLSDNLIGTIQGLRPLSFNTRLRSLDLEGTPLLTKGKEQRHHRAAILHLLPSLRSLDGKPFFSPTSSMAPSKRFVGTHKSGQVLATTEVNDVANSYVALHGKAAASGPLGGGGTRLPPRYARDTEAERARRGPSDVSPYLSQAQTQQQEKKKKQQQQQAFLSPPPPRQQPRYIPPWRRPPKPIPYGWRDYAKMAQASVVKKKPQSQASLAVAARLFVAEAMPVAAVVTPPSSFSYGGEQPPSCRSSSRSEKYSPCHHHHSGGFPSPASSNKTTGRASTDRQEATKGKDAHFLPSFKFWDSLFHHRAMQQHQHQHQNNDDGGGWGRGER